MSDLSRAIPGLAKLWSVTKGDPRVTVAVIDGPVDGSHPCFAGASLGVDQLKGHSRITCRDRWQGSCHHGTEIASLLFAQHGAGPVRGIAPGCRGLIVPVFRDHPLVSGAVLPASQADLARAIRLACDRGADVINVSSGELAPGGAAAPALVEAVKRCVQRGVLIVSAAGNDGCDCLHVPAALPGVLVVGALDRAGQPAPFSNYGERYRQTGVLAPGDGLTVASTGSRYETRSGTSYAAPLVAGVAALLMSVQYQRGQRRPHITGTALGDLIIRSARGCASRDPRACRRVLAGSLDVERALSLLTQGGPMSTPNSDEQPIDEPQRRRPDAVDESGLPGMDTTHTPRPRSTPPESPAYAAPLPAVHTSAYGLPAVHAQVRPSCSGGGKCSCGGGGGECSCGGGGTCSGSGAESAKPTLVYALGTLSYDFGTQARFDSLAAAIEMDERAPATVVGPIPASIDTGTLLDHLTSFPHVAESITWTINLDATSIYAIRPDGAFAARTYELLRQFLADQVDAKVRAERVSVPGYLVGTQTLLTGQQVGVVVPELRGMYNWTTGALVDRVAGKRPDSKATKADRETFARKEQGLVNFLQRVYFEVRNVGLEPRDRALNFAATNAFQIEQLFGRAANEGLQLDEIVTEQSPVCRLDSECWDIILYFFNPANVLGEARRAYRFTVDVSDVVPVLVGGIREWSVR